MGCCNGISLNQVESATAIYDDLNSSAFLKELKCGSLQALEHLDRTLTPHLIGFLCFAMDVPEADAEELVSDALFAVTSHVHTFQRGGPAKLTTWIFEIAKNKAIDFHRKLRLDAVPIDDKFPDRGPAGPDAGRNKHYLSWLNGELAKLGEADRMLLLWRAKDISYEQIAPWLGISEGAARTRHSRLRAQLVKAAEAARPKEGESQNG
jgi:RNA polymerase sigma factor (sigma-70 family)